MIPDLTALPTDKREALMHALYEIDELAGYIYRSGADVRNAIRLNSETANEAVGRVVQGCKILGNWGKQIEEMCR